MGISFWQIAIVVVLVVLLFGRGKISGLMADLAKGIKSFKAGMRDDEVATADPSEIESEKVKSAPASDSGKDETAKS